MHQRLDELTRRLESFTRTGPAAYAPRRQSEENQTAALIGRLDQRLDQMVGQPQPTAAPPLAPTMPAMPAGGSKPSPGLHVPMPPALDRALSEIAARQRTLNGEPAATPAPMRPVVAERQPPVPMPSPAAEQQPAAAPPAPAPTPVAVPTQDISGLEQQLRKITDQIETLRKPGVEEAINALREELGDIGRSLNDAMPKQAIDTIEKQIAGLNQRIAEGRQAGVDAGALAGIEHGLMEVRDALHGLTPAEHLVGFNEAVAGLAQKIDLIVAQRDPATLQQLESAITTLRGMASNVASNEAVGRLAGEVQSLADKVDQIGHGPVGDVLNSLEHRIDALSQALAERAQAGSTVPPRLEALVQSLADKIEQIQHSRDDNVAVNHLEDRIVTLVERLDASDSRLDHLEAIERGLTDLLVHLEEMRATPHETQDGDSPAFDAFKQDIARSQDALKLDMVRSQDSLKQDMARTQDALDAVHGTLGLLVDRLAMIERNIRSERPAAPPAAAPAAPPPADDSEPLELTEPVGKLAVRLINDSPEPAPESVTTEHASAASALEQALATAQPPIPAPMPAPESAPTPAAATPAPQAKPQPQPAPVVPPQTKPQPPSTPPAPGPAPAPQPLPAASQLPINPDLPPDQPLEPGSGPPQFRAHPAARIAASEAALGGARPASLSGNSQSNFIAAARRAAKAAMQEPAADAPQADTAQETDVPSNQSLRAKMMKRVKSLLVAASIVAIVVGSVQIAGKLFHHGDGSTKTAQGLIPEPAQAPARKVASAPSASNPLMAPATIAVPQHKQQVMARSTADLLSAPALYPPSDITGSIPDAARSQQTTPPPRPVIPAQDEERLPSTIGSQRLRQAALAGNAGAAYEVAVRYAEGHGVPADPREAARWYERAASMGLAAAQFRYASMLEKGHGVKKDLARARQFYLAAAKQGNAKAMHNLAVLYAEGVDGKPDYATAVTWFRKAARHGVDDSQYNLGILYARGIGVPKNLVESYKWFALAAAHGDQESAKKRDHIASQLDAKQLAAARRAVKDFKIERQPDKATAVPAPPGGWEKAKAAPARSHRHGGQPMPLGAFTIGKR